MVVYPRACPLSMMASKKGKSLSQEEIFANFQRMRSEQQAIISKITELEGDKNEHRWADLADDRDSQLERTL